jgi:CDP-diacylglycerol---serine O-phosphatidyltransferase
MNLSIFVFHLTFGFLNPPMRSFIPHLFTLGNLLCGAIATLAVASSDYSHPAVFLIFLAAFLDLLDGAVARALKVDGPLGKELDSLADVVSFGLAPSAIAFSLLWPNGTFAGYLDALQVSDPITWLPLVSFLLVLGAAFRLAKFNIDTTQSTEFKGMPSPATGLFWASIALIQWESAPVPHVLSAPSIAALTVITAYLMVSPIRMFSFKFKTFGWAGNELRYLFLASIPLVVFLSYFLFNLYSVSLPLLLLLYAFISTVRHIAAPRP